MADSNLVPIKKRPRKADLRSQELVREHAANELVFAVVGHVGSGTSTVANELKGILARQGFDVEILKAREQIEKWARKVGRELPLARRSIESAIKLQDWGDEMRKANTEEEEEQDHAVVARCLIGEIRRQRGMKIGMADIGDDPVLPDGHPRAYILDAIRHHAEVHLLRTLYQNAFTLIGVVCDEDQRVQRLITTKFEDAGADKAKTFMKRDAKAQEKYGQRVSDAFHLADVFLDNSANQKDKDGKENRAWDIPEQLSRLVKLITHAEVIRPYLDETAMYQAYGAQMRSACLSRQVGAALVDGRGNIVATGTNEVPRAGGGVYGEVFEIEREDCTDERCARRDPAYCSNTREQNEIISELFRDLNGAGLMIGQTQSVMKLLRNSRIGELLEFSRAVHAEMDALLTAGRKGIPTVGTRLFVTTFPCHYCARHLVAAGVDEVQYIEPYPKSRALDLHKDSITKNPLDWSPPSRGNGHDKVLFRPFTGVAPRMYRRAFLKDRELKDKDTGDMRIEQPSWVSPWHLTRLSYAELEVKLARMEDEA